MKTNRTVTTLLGIALLPVLFGGLQAAHAQGETTVQEDANTAGFTMIESAVHNGIPKKGSTGSNRTPRWSPWGDFWGVGQGICNPL